MTTNTRSIITNYANQHREPRSIITNYRSITTNIRFIITNTRSMTTHTRSMITNHANQQIVADNIYSALKQTPLTNHYSQINTINKNNTNVTCKVKERSSTKNSKKNANKQNNKKPICYKCKKIGHYPNNCIFDKNCRN